MSLACIVSLSLRDRTSNLIWIAKLIKGLIVRRLEVVVYHAALFLLSQCEVVSFELGSEAQVVLSLCLLANALVLFDELLLSL